MTDNLTIWKKLERTDPKATKPFQKSGGFKGTQIDPTYRLQLMTEVFGPVGQGWGYVEDDLKISHDMAFSKVRVWYVPAGADAAVWPEGWRETYPANARWTGPQWGGTEMMPERGGKPKPTDECLKMSITDALGKCLLQLGLAADIYMGQFDDSKYREESEAYFAAKSNPELQPAAIAAFEADVKKRLDACLDLDDMEELWRTAVGSRLREIGTVDKEAQRRIYNMFGAKKEAVLRGEGEAAGQDNNPPDIPLLIPVPMLANDAGTDWERWRFLMSKAIDGAPTLDLLNETLKANKAAFDGLKAADKGAFEFLKDRAAKKRSVFQGVPSQAAE
ncbi:hypothetical protein Sp245p_03345 [Azospirillum baldaniorum]|uniref:Uncharacterized protein n=1 Tax=Azospirillum baldaniorum TaxID=1064539 RepID=A0A9P1JT94_9PROT|nr:hypothetical protein [Azospirillum baldaniorum]AWJ88889.1 hypothetical protein Sp245p_03345 [Azospirillum baldaniorum]TWA73401.1 hypothetical protein FBZ85_11693 [Azospirillum brasilense]CCC99405.1 conserved protein of unknown function [Azospirillum baldaniorum]